MNPIRTDLAAASPRVHESDIPMPLTERLHLQMGTRSPSAREPEPGQAAQDTPILQQEPLSEAMQGLVRDWARQMFTEKMMYGEEEETGIPPLSIDI